MGDIVIRLRNVVGLAKLETTENTDPTVSGATDAFPFEIDSLSIGSPFTTEQSGEATGTMIAGAPLIIGQAVPVSIRMRMKGAGAGQTYSASIKPPAHALLAACGLRGLFTDAVAATALTAGTTTSGTLATPFAATAQLYRGQRLILAGTPFPGAHPLITDYTVGRLATMSDLFGSALTTGTTAQILPNWTYAMTSPQTDVERAADQPSCWLAFNEDGIVYKLGGFRGSIRLADQTSRPGFFEMSGMAIWNGQADQAIPSAVVANHAAPTLNMQAAISPAFSVDRKPLPISNFSFDWASQVDSYEDPNTPNGFGAGQIGGREPALTCDPLKTRLSVRNHLAALESGSGPFVGAVRAGTVSGNRWALTLPRLVPASVEMATRGNARSENLTFRAQSPGRDSAGRDGDAILCFD